MNRSNRTALIAVAAALALPAWGDPAPSKGYQLQLTIRSVVPALQTGDPIPIELTIRNEGPDDYKYLDRTYDHSGRMEEFQLAAVDSQGEAIADPRSRDRAGLGGFAGDGTLKAGQSFRRQIELNLWAALLPPGKYQVTGTYHPDRLNYEQVTVGSAPISIEVKPRSDAEMRQYIDSLAARLSNPNEKAPNELLKRLAYTSSPQAAAPLLDALYRSEPYWAEEAFLVYIPLTPEVRSQVISAAKARGLAIGIEGLLERFGLTSEERFEITQRSFASPDPRWRLEAAYVASREPDDRYTPALIELAKSPGIARERAIYALAGNRTDESVQALKKLLADPDPRVRKQAELAVRLEYRVGAQQKGRPLRPEDFPVELQTESR